MPTLPALNLSRDSFKPRRPDADDILREEGIKDWSDKTILITGASAGIGVETAKAFAKVGAQLILPVRDMEKATKVVADIQKETDGKANITLLTLDLASLQSVRECAAEFVKLNRPLNILILNAGIMAPPEALKTKDGIDMQFGTNHLAHFLLFELLKEKLIKSSTKEFNSRVVTVSSGGHRISDIIWDDINFEKDVAYDPFKAYGQSKSANVLMAREIEKRYGNQGLHANSIHPGVIFTELARHMTQEAIAGLMKAFPVEIKTVPQGAATTVWAASAKEFEGKGGEYLEDCSHSYVTSEAMSPDGMFPHIYDEASAARLYDLSLQLVGLSS